MTETLMQCCYTNAAKEVAGKLSSGWQAVVVSDNLSSDAYANCVNFQNANSTIQSHMVDEQGNVLNLFEIIGDGAYVYVMRTQYGLTDRLGRPNMFSHAYIFSWKREDVLNDPNVFLTLLEGNFAKDEESARKPREALERSEPFTLKRAMERAGLTAATYLTLIRCVYAQYSDRKAAKPLYVQYDGTEEQMQAILYCIYYGLPYFVRRSLSVASAAANTAKSRNLIFSMKAASHDSFVVPATGENNIVTPRTERRIARCGFVEFAALHFADDGFDNNDYFQTLEKKAVELGDSTASDELILKIAHQMLEETVIANLPPAELDRRLSDALRSKSYGSPQMDDYITSMLNEVLNRKMSLTEENETNLARRLSAPVSEAFAKVGEQYNIYRLSTLSAEDAAKMLSNMPDTMFKVYAQTLSKDDKGREILDYFYAFYALQGKEITWDSLEELAIETGHVRGAVKSKESIEEAAWKLYCEEIEKPKAAQDAYNSLMQLMLNLYPGETYRVHNRGQMAKEAYWEKQSFETFCYDNFEEYQHLHIETARYQRFIDLCKVLDAYKQNGEDAFFQELNRFAVEYESLFFGDQNRARLIQEKMEAELLEISGESRELSGWIGAVFCPGAQYVLESILTLRAALQDHELDKVAGLYQKIAGHEHFSNYAAAVKTLAKTVLEECRKIDGPENWAPLDVWLALGRTLYPRNAFRIFDEGDPYVLHVEDEEAVRPSELLRTSRFINQAETYIQDKGTVSKIVHKWLNELKAQEKRRRANERKAQKETEGSVWGWGRSLISQLTSGGDSKPGRRSMGKNGKRNADVPAPDGTEPDASDLEPPEEDAPEKKQD